MDTQTHLSVMLRTLPDLIEHELQIFKINVSYNILIFVYQLRRYRPVVFAVFDTDWNASSVLNTVE